MYTFKSKVLMHPMRARTSTLTLTLMPMWARISTLHVLLQVLCSAESGRWARRNRAQVAEQHAAEAMGKAHGERWAAVDDEGLLRCWPGNDGVNETKQR